MPQKRRKAKYSIFEYIRYNYGPFDKKIYNYVTCLLANGTFCEGARVSSTGDEFVTYRLSKNAKVSSDKINDEERAILDEVLLAVEGHGAKALTELAYRTKPMKKIGAEIGNARGLLKVLDLSLA